MSERLFRWIAAPLLIVMACGLYRMWAAPARPSIELTRREPLAIRPRYNLPEVATDSQLFAVLDRMKPPGGTGSVNTNNLVHALRLWGAKADFGDPDMLSGAEMRDFYLNDAHFRQLAGPDAPPLFDRGDEGVRVRAWDQTDKFRDTSAVHTDDLLATLAESGVPLDAPLVTRGGTVAVSDLLAAALDRFHLTQQEYEWSVISYARYVFPNTMWHNRYGQQVTVESLIDELIDHPLEQGVCGGTHRLEALVVLYRADEQARVISRRARRRMLEHMAKISSLLVASQHADGYWTRHWTEGTAKEDGLPVDSEQRILLTGHHLEWLALAPPEVQPPRETIVRAGQWLVRALTESDQETLVRRYGPFSHAARALCLWRSKEPFQAWNELAKQQLAQNNP